MTRIGTLDIAARRCAVFAALACLPGIGMAQNLPSLARTDSRWVSRPAPGEENPFRDDGSAADHWQPTRPAGANPSTAAPAPATGAATATRWLSPNHTSNPSASPQNVDNTTQARGSARPSSTSASSSNTLRDLGINTATRSPAAREPRPFVPPADALQLAADSQSAAPTKRPTAAQTAASAPAPRKPASNVNDSAARPPAQPRVAQATPAGRPPASQVQRTSSNGSAARPNDSAARSKPSAANQNSQNLHAAHPSSRAGTRSAAARPRPHAAPHNRTPGEAGWIRPLKQVAYHFSSDHEMEELPMPDGPSGRHPNAYYLPNDGPYGGPGEEWSDGDWIGAPYGEGCGDGCCDPMCGDGVECGCEPSCGCPTHDDLFCLGWGDDESCHTIRVRVPKIQEVVVFGGVHGFKGPYDRDRDSGNFGFQEGFNLGAKLPYTDFGYQFGYQATQSQLNGDADTGITDPFSQHFITAGVFRRTRDGFQGGVAWDLLIDERHRTAEFSQLRAEMSYVDCGCHEFGAMLAIHLNDEVFIDDELQTNSTYRATDQYLLFYRLHGKNGGEGRVFGGFTDDSDGIIGADFLLPLKDSWSLQSTFTYLIPEEGGGSVGARQEAWNIGINLVWHWKGRARKSHSNPYRPLFNVADNGSLIIDDRP